MADVKISQLTAITSPADSAELEIAEGGVSYKVTKANLLSSVTNTATVVKSSLASAEIKTLGTSAVTLVSAPGANSFIEVLDIVAIYRYSTEAFNFSAGALEFLVGVEEVATLSHSGTPSGFLNETATIMKTLSPDAVEYTDSSINAALTMQSNSGDATTGDGSLVVSVLYRIVDLSQ